MVSYENIADSPSRIWFVEQMTMRYSSVHLTWGWKRCCQCISGDERCSCRRKNKYDNGRVNTARERIRVKWQETSNELSYKVDRNSFTCLLDELTNDQAKWINNNPNNVMKSFVTSSNTIVDMVTQEAEESVCVTDMDKRV